LLSGKANPRLLVVDDDKLVRETVCRVLVSAGYEVTAASEGEEAMTMLEAGAADVVIVDIFMPKMDGLEVIREIRARWPGVRILAMSGGSQRINTDMLSAARAFGADTSLAKPFLPSDLVAALRRLLDEEA
jgi:CheY-like chemotaxis protein